MEATHQASQAALQTLDFFERKGVLNAWLEFFTTNIPNTEVGKFTMAAIPRYKANDPTFTELDMMALAFSVMQLEATALATKQQQSRESPLIKMPSVLQ